MTAAVSVSPTTTSPVESLAMMMRALKLPSFARYAGDIAQKAEREGWTFGQYLHHLAELEIHERRRRRIERYLKDSDLLPEKTLATLSRARLTPKVAKMLPTLCEGGFVERGDNLLAFGLPGRGNHPSAPCSPTRPSSPRCSTRSDARAPPARAPPTRRAIRRACASLRFVRPTRHRLSSLRGNTTAPLARSPARPPRPAPSPHYWPTMDYSPRSSTSSPAR